MLVSVSNLMLASMVQDDDISMEKARLSLHSNIDADLSGAKQCWSLWMEMMMVSLERYDAGLYGAKGCWSSWCRMMLI